MPQKVLQKSRLTLHGLAGCYTRVTDISQERVERILVKAGLDLGALAGFDPADSEDTTGQLSLKRKAEKMVAPQLYTSRFSNQYGEQWVFEYDLTKREGVLRGSDVDWQEYRVVDGLVPELVLSNEEIVWLRKAWAAATGRQ